MHQEREDLDIIFRKTTPESVLRELKEQKKGSTYDNGRVLFYSGEDYLRIAYGRNTRKTSCNTDMIRLQRKAEKRESFLCSICMQGMFW